MLPPPRRPRRAAAASVCEPADLLALLEELAKEDALAVEVAFSCTLLEHVVQYSVCVDKGQIVSSVGEYEGEAAAENAHGGERAYLQSGAEGLDAAPTLPYLGQRGRVTDHRQLRCKLVEVDRT
jgi:hypothetical protein